jgi:hypothetical protein
MKLAAVGWGTAAVALLVGAILWLRWEEAPAAVELGPAPEAPTKAAEVSVQLASPEEKKDESSAVERAAIESAAAPAEPVVVGANAEKVRLRGRVVVIELDGTERTDASGRFFLGAWVGERGKAVPVTYEAGAWEAEIGFASEFNELSVEELRIGERPATVEEPTGRIALPESGELVVRARRSPPANLRVVDAENHLDLDGITLVRSEEFPRADVGHPGCDFEARVVARDLSSPVSLDAHYAGLERYSQMRFFVGAPAHAWQLVQIEPTAGGETLVSLERGADLSVSVRGVDPAAGAALRLRSESRFQPVADVDLRADGTLEFEGLVPGELRVVAEIGDAFRSPLLLGEQRVALIAGGRADVDLVLEAAPELAIARGAGTVFVPQAWKANGVTVQLQLLDPPLGESLVEQDIEAETVQSSRAGFDAFHWERDGLQAGRYFLATRQPRIGVVVELPARGREDLDLEVPPPAELTVHVVDEITGQPVEVDELNWIAKPPEGVLGVEFERAFWDAQARVYRIRAPATEIELMAWAWQYQPYDEEIDLRGAAGEHTVRLKRGCGLTLRLVDGETPVLFPKGWADEPTAVIGTGHTALMQFGDFERKYMVTEPGTYKLQLPAIKGFVQPPVLEVDIRPGEFTERVVALERAH